jgi:two-component system chemotaxis response regulator CheY
VRLLAVDDDVEFLQALADQLEDFGFQVETVPSGAEALRRLKSSRFDAILLDVMMPVMSGDEVARRIRTQRRYDEIPIVLLTCLTDARTISDSILSGANYYVSKTSSPEALVEVVRQAVLLSRSSPDTRAAAPQAAPPLEPDVPLGPEPELPVSEDHAG